MTISPHIFASAALGSFTSSPGIAFLLGFVLHFVLDALPHLDLGTFNSEPVDNEKPWPAWIYLVAIGEFFVSVMLFYFLFHNRSDFYIISMGALGGIALDLIDNNPFSFFIRSWPIFKQLHFLHEKIHFRLTPEKWYWGLPSQIIIMGVSIWYLLKY